MKISNYVVFDLFCNLGRDGLFLVAKLGLALLCDLVGEGFSLVVPLDKAFLKEPLHQP